MINYKCNDLLVIGEVVRQGESTFINKIHYDILDSYTIDSSKFDYTKNQTDVYQEEIIRGKEFEITIYYNLNVGKEYEIKVVKFNNPYNKEFTLLSVYSNIDKDTLKLTHEF